MNEVLNPDTRFLNASQLIDAASLLDALHKRTIKSLDRLQADDPAVFQSENFPRLSVLSLTTPEPYGHGLPQP